MTKTNNSDFVAAIYQIADDNDLPQETVLDVIKRAILTAYKKAVKDEIELDDEILSSYSVDIDNETGEFIVLADKKVVSVVTDQSTQLLESQAKLIDPRLREGDHIQIDVTPDNFGRIAAQAAKQRITQGLRDAVREAMIEKYEDKVGKIISGIVQRKDPNYVRVEVDRAEAIMPNEEQIPGEYYRSAERRRFLLLRLYNSQTDRRMILSRASADFLKALFEVEVPEVSTGSVEIVDIAREAGSRSKVAVRSMHEKVDAIGSCVGPRGTRIDSIMNEVNPEKVDIILWDKETKTFIINSLSPAKVVDIKIDKETQHAKVLVAEDMLSLAIGKDGQNVRLAAKLTGYKIDITANKDDFEGKAKEVVEEKMPEVTENITETLEEIDTQSVNNSIAVAVDAIPELTERQRKLLKEAHIDTIAELQSVAKGEVSVEGFTKKDVEKMAKLVEGSSGADTDMTTEGAGA
jgi:transcription termination/antitermination protein NusA